MSIIRRICQYCDTCYGTKDGQGMSGDSHGICKECMKKSDDELDAIAKAKRKTFGQFIK